jgi:peptide/nickel transport system permease protein
VRQGSRGKVGILFAYITRRLGMMMLIVFGASYLAYNLQALSSNPLAAYAESTEENKEFLMNRAIRELNLDVPPPLRYFIWFRGFIAGLWGQFDLGKTRDGEMVLDAIGAAIPVTFRLVIASTILAIVLGITIGMVTAIRQYSRFDYTMTFISFLLFSLPIFWVAVLLKEYMAIGFNDFLMAPQIPIGFLIAFSVVGGFIMAGIMGGDRRRFLMVFTGVTVLNAALLQYLSVTSWFVNPGIGIIGVAVFAFGFSVLVTQISTGLDNRPSLISSLAAATIVVAGYFPLQMLMNSDASFLTVVGVFAITMGLSAVVGYFASNIDRRVNIRTAMLTALLATLPVILDRFMQEFSNYMNSDAIYQRPIPTLGQANDLLTEEQRANFWINGLDSIMHLILPTVALTLVSFAGYVRFSRGSLLEVLNMDYIRTARAKGLTERTVIVRHGLRNAMLPMTTILVNDFAGVIGGAIITESIFAWKGMGSLFNQAINSYDLNLFMGVFIIGASLTVIANLVSDLLYGVVDPRIRLRK